MRIILQARTASQRLPAKALLPVAGIPLAVLCAKRLGRGGVPVLLATSCAPSDDELAAVASGFGVIVHRGALNNVAERFHSCTHDMNDEDWIVRATGDNPLADAEVLTLMTEDLKEIGGDFLGMQSYPTMPYGLGVEIFRAGRFRHAWESGPDADMIENVTPPLIPSTPPCVPDPERFGVGCAGQRLRVTVDTLEDYLLTARAFRSAADPVVASWRTLAETIFSLRTERAHAEWA